MQRELKQRRKLPEAYRKLAKTFCVYSNETSFSTGTEHVLSGFSCPGAGQFSFTDLLRALGTKWVSPAFVNT